MYSLIIILGLISTLFFAKDKLFGYFDKYKKNELLTFCPHHPDNVVTASCAICDRFFCDACMRPFKTLHFCSDHYPLIIKNNWVNSLTVITTPTDPEFGVRLYKAKKELYDLRGVLVYIETQYKFNQELAEIETHLLIFSNPDVSDLVKKTFMTCKLEKI